MIDMRNWETLTVDVVREIHLDPRNVRLETEANAPEADIMHDLFRNEKALQLVESIAKVGYLTHEVPIVLRRSRRLYVVEGNRRVAALKAIQNPYLVPEFQARISTLVQALDDRDALRKIEVKRAPNQQAADQLVAALHTGNQRVPWTPPRQAAFFQAQLDAGRTLAQLRSQYPLIEVDKFVLRSKLLERFRRTEYSSDAMTDYVRSRNVPITVLARIYESKEFIELTGLKLDEEGDLDLSISDPCFDRMAQIIVSGMHSGDITTRSVGTVNSARYKSLMSELRECCVDRPATTPTSSSAARSGSGSTATGGGEAGGGATGAGASGSSGGAGRKKTPVSPALDVTGMSPPSSFPESIGLILEELSTLDVRRYPNAAFDLIRTLLEKTIKAYAESLNIEIKRSGKAKDGYVFLKQSLEWAEEHFKQNEPRQLAQVARKLQAGRVNDYFSSMDHLNAINHNHHIFATESEVRQGWGGIRSLLLGMMK